MKTIVRLGVILSVIALIGIGWYLLFQNPAVQNWLGAQIGAGRGGGSGQVDRRLLPNEKNELPWVENEGRRDLGGDREAEESFEGGKRQGKGRGKFSEPLPLSVGLLGLFGIFLRLAILMALVIALVKMGRWLARNNKPSARVKG
ncbi:MAG: hypothetical protein ACK44E_10330 [Anaerolineales bacterium]